MKKIITLAMLMIILSLTVGATDLQSLDVKYSVSFLRKLDVAPKDKETDSKMTRLEFITMLMCIKDGDVKKKESVSVDAYELREEYADIEKYTVLPMGVITAELSGMLNGKIEQDNKLVLGLEEEITWKEALIFVERAVHPFFDTMYHDINNGSDSWLLECAQRDRIINLGLHSADAFRIDDEDLYNAVTFGEACVVLNRLLHIPCGIESYAGGHTQYYIDMFVERLLSED